MQAFSQNIKKVLPVDVFIVDGARFSKLEVNRLIERTSRKLEKTGIAIQVASLSKIDNKKLAFVNDENVEILLKGFGAPNRLRLFFIREYSDPNHDSWTYDPVLGGDTSNDSHWKGAVFFTDAWADFDEHMYEFRGFPKSADTFLHELGHVLLQEANHVMNSTTPNFFNDNPTFCDDTISPGQAKKMLKSEYLQSIPISVAEKQK